VFLILGVHMPKKIIFLSISLLLFSSWTLHLEGMDQEGARRQALKRSSNDLYIANDEHNKMQQTDDVADVGAEGKKVKITYDETSIVAPVVAALMKPAISAVRAVDLPVPNKTQSIPAANPAPATANDPQNIIAQAVQLSNAKSNSNDDDHDQVQAARVERPTFSFIRNTYTERRGAPAMLDIQCLRCNRSVIYYQKDGPGRLLRCYLDRIHYPESIKNRQYERFNVRTSPLLRCVCSAAIGTPMIYQSENRPAYRMFNNTFRITDITQRGKRE
jgi:hypothetical protein